MPDIRNYLVIGLGAALVALLALAGVQRAQLHDERAAHARTKQQHAEVLRDLAERTARVAGAALHAQQAQARAVAALDSQHTKELSHAKREIGLLRTGLRDGAYGLRIHAAYPNASGGPDVPQTSVAPRLADADAPRLTPDAEQAYFDHREAIATVRQMILGLQDYARAVQE